MRQATMITKITFKEDMTMEYNRNKKLVHEYMINYLWTPWHWNKCDLMGKDTISHDVLEIIYLRFTSISYLLGRT